MMRPETIIRGGTVIDGTGAAGVVADVAVGGGRIVAVDELDPLDDCVVLDAEGMTVAPGFIDIHSHSDFTLLVDPRAVSSISQGVTLEVIGNCGFGCSPIGDPASAREVIYGYRDDVPLTWTTMAGYLRRLEGAAPAVNVMALVPNGQLRLATVGLKDQPANAAERRAMARLLEEALDEGAFGYSTGLEYATEKGATEDEVAELCAVVARRGGLYATHTRNRDEAAVEAVEEAVRTAERVGVRLQVSHITPRGGRADTERAIALVEAAARRGVDAAFDMHTRLFGTTYLKVLLPAWALEGRPDDIAARLRDPDMRAQFRTQRNLISALGDWSRVVLLDNEVTPQLARRDFADIAREKGKDPLDCAYDALLAHVEAIHVPMVIIHSYSEDLLRLTYEHPLCTVGSDATALAPDGALADSTFHGAYTWASWFYRRMVRETGAFTPEAGIRKLTGAPAERLGLADRGVLRAGAAADVAVFDPETFGETGTTFEPNQVAVGMRHVVVNGVIALRDGHLTESRGGQVLRAAAS